MDMKKSAGFILAGTSVCGLLLGTILMMGCEKKDRLSAAAAEMAINPPATTVLKGSTKTFTVGGTAVAGAAATEITWDLTPDVPAADMPTTIGYSININFNSAGAYILQADYSAYSAQSQIIVVNSITNPTDSFNIYTDAGFPADSTQPATSLTLQELVGGGEVPEGNKYMRATGVTVSRWGVDLGSNYVSLDDFTGGTLIFYIRKSTNTSSPAVGGTGGVFTITLRKTDDTTAAVATNSNKWHSPANGGVGNALSEYTNGGVDVWQKVVINLSEFFSGTGNVELPFQFSSSIGVVSTVDIDNVHFEKP